MKRKIVVILLTAALLNCCGLPGAAETNETERLTLPAQTPAAAVPDHPLPDSHQTQTIQTAIRANLDERLRAVTELAKERCGVSDRYTDFRGNQETEYGRVRWRLRWWDENGSVNITCDEAGYPYQFSCYENEGWEYEPYSRAPGSRRRHGKLPRYRANVFWKNVLRENEKYRLELPEKRLSLNPGRNHLSAVECLLRDGLRTDIRLYAGDSIRRDNDGAILLAWRRLAAADRSGAPGSRRPSMKRRQTNCSGAPSA